MPLEGENLDRDKDARFSMLEKLADHDDELMEQLLEDIPPPRDKVFDDLAKELRDGLVVPGADGRRDPHQRRAAPAQGAAPRGAQRGGHRQAARRQAGSEPLAYVLKTLSTGHAGKMSIARVLSGQIGDGVTLLSPEREAGRVSGTFKLLGQTTEKRGPAQAGETVALGKLEYAKTGDTLSAGKQAACGARRGEAASGGAGDFGLGERAQGRRQARPGAAQADRGGPLDPSSCTTPRPTRW